MTDIMINKNKKTEIIAFDRVLICEGVTPTLSQNIIR